MSILILKPKHTNNTMTKGDYIKQNIEILMNDYMSYIETVQTLYTEDEINCYLFFFISSNKT